MLEARSETLPTRVLLVGEFLADLPLLVAALELAEVGLSVQIVQQAGGVDAAATGAALPALPDAPGTLRELCGRLAAPLQAGGQPHPGLTAQLQTASAPALFAEGEWVQLPAQSLLGVPGVPLARDSMAALGTGGALRAALDRLRPVLTIGKAHSFGQLVRQRMGGQVLTRFVAPLVFQQLGAAAADVSPARCIPGLNESITRAGSLSGAVVSLLTDDEWLAKHAAVLPAAGWDALYAALCARLRNYGVEFVVAADAAYAADAAAADTDAAVAAAVAADGAAIAEDDLIISAQTLLEARAEEAQAAGDGAPQRSFRAHWFATIPDAGALPAGELVAVIPTAADAASAGAGEDQVALWISAAEDGIRRVVAAGSAHPEEGAAAAALPTVQLAATGQLAAWGCVPESASTVVAPALALGETAALVGVASRFAIRLRRELLGLAE